MLTRDDFRALVNYDNPKLDARARRDQLPFINADLIDGEAPAAGARKPYRAIDAYYTMIVDDLNERLGLPLDRACSLTVALSDFIVPALPRIAASAAAISRGEPAAEIYGGAVEVVRMARAGRGGRAVETWLPLLGTADKLSAAIADHEPVAAVALVNLSRIAALLRQRAEKHRIDLGELFTGGAAVTGATLKIRRIE